MNDSEARGLVLQRFYEIRHETEYAQPKNFRKLADDLGEKVLFGIVRQLDEKGLVNCKLHASMSGTDFFVGHISASGIDVIERTAAPPFPIIIPVSIDSSVSVHGSQNVQIGGQGNTQTVTMDFEKMSTIVDSSNASLTEKEEAKSLLKKISENKLVQVAISSLFKRLLG